jgi:hypothetical protein
MSNIMFVLSIFIFVLILGMFQSSQENLTFPNVLDYRWGLKSEKESEDDDSEEINEKPHHRHHRHRRDKRHRRRYPENRDCKVEIDEVVGEYQCHYVPGDNQECKKAFNKCSIKDHPDINKYILKTKIPPPPDMNEYILKTEIPIVEQDLTDYIHKDELPDMSKFIPKDQLPDMSEYIRKSDLDKYQKKCPPSPKCPTCPECPTCPIPEGVDMDKYMLRSECKKEQKSYKITDDNKVSFGDLLPSFMRGKAKCVIDDDFRRQSYQKRC